MVARLIAAKIQNLSANHEVAHFSPGGALANSQGRKTLVRPLAPNQGPEGRKRSLSPLRALGILRPYHQGLATLAIDYRPSGAKNVLLHQRKRNYRCDFSRISATRTAAPFCRLLS